MSLSRSTFGLAAGIALAALGVSSQQAAAQQTATIVTGAGATAPWPVWVLGGGVVSLMIRAAVVHNTECRELTLNEAVTGMAPVWPAYHKKNVRCGGQGRPNGNPCVEQPPGDIQPTSRRTTRGCPPPRGACEPTRTSQQGNPTFDPNNIVGQRQRPRPRAGQCPDGFVFVPVAGAIVVKY